MKKFGILLFSLLTLNSFSQISKIDSGESNTWSIGGGVSNFIMHGDMRSFGTGNGENHFNFGGFLSASKMLNPILGLEFKTTFSNMSGGSQKFFDGYDLKYVNQNVNRENLMFKGCSYGSELNLMVNLTNLYKRRPKKYIFTSYLGMGYHFYDSALYLKDDNGSYQKISDADFGSNKDRKIESKASSFYLSGQLGLRRKINKTFDVEFRTGMYFNYEDHLDASVSDKQTWETFFTSSVGLIVKLGKKESFASWKVESGDSSSFRIIDTDNDGVMDALDVEPSTPKGVMVYGNGKAVDSDRDGLPDYKDNCPLEYGDASNGGCSMPGDTKNINQQIKSLSSNIYFEPNSDRINSASFSTLNEIINLMGQVPNVRFVVEGHTDDKFSNRYNLYLSERRAFNVKKYFIMNGFDATKIEAKGYGESMPKYSNLNAGGRQLNRRVEIKPLINN